MKFAYTIWCNRHYHHIDDILEKTKDTVDYYIVTTMPSLDRSKDSSFTSDGIESSYLDDNWVGENKLVEVLTKCHTSGNDVVLQIIPTPTTAEGKQPFWWQGWVEFTSTSKASIWFGRYKDIIDRHKNQLPLCSRYIIGAEMVSTLKYKDLWADLLSYARDTFSSSKVTYSHHFSLPLKNYYSFTLSLLVFFGHMFRGKKIYSDILDRLLVNPFLVPAEQRYRVGKNLYEAPYFNKSIDYVKLNDYFWYVMDKRYTVEELGNRWESIVENGIRIEFLPAVRKWVEKYCSDKEVWIENDLNIGYNNCSQDYYNKWWEVFINKHIDIADVVVCWDNGDYDRWVKAINHI